VIERILVLFLDGVGLGQDDPASNPLAIAEMPTLTGLLNGRRPVQAGGGSISEQSVLKGVDAQLQIPGLPQSGTGQTSILTGVNAAAHLGRHDGPYPNSELQHLLAEDNLFKSLPSATHPAAFANTYSDRFLARLERGTQRLSANGRAALLAGLPLLGPEALAQGRAVSSLLTNDYFRQIGYDMPDIPLEEAGRNLAVITHDNSLTYFEFWYTDVVGHRQDWDMAIHVLSQLDRFLTGLLAHLDLNTTLFLIISDHGNLEDLTTNKHTENPALCVLAGAGHNDVANSLVSLTDVKPSLVSALLNR